MNNKTIFAVIGVLVCLLAFGVGFLAFNRKEPAVPAAGGGSGVVTPQGGAAADGVKGAAPNAAGAAAAPGAVAEADKEPTLAAQLEDFDTPVWRKMAAGLETDITKKEIRIHGVSQYADWAHGNGIVANTPIPDGDFTLSVDIKIAKFEGNTSYKNPYIRVEARDRSAIGIYANPAYHYMLHDWKNPQTQSSVHRMFGDEATTYHRMTMRWQEGTGNAIATVDKELIGTIKTNLGTGRRISLFANTQTKGIDIDVYFRNLKVEIPDSTAGGI